MPGLGKPVLMNSGSQAATNNVLTVSTANRKSVVLDALWTRRYLWRLRIMKTTKCKKKPLSGYGLRLSLLNGASDTFFCIPLSFKYVFQDCFNSNIQSFCFLFSFQYKRRNLDYVKQKTRGSALQTKIQLH